MSRFTTIVISVMALITAAVALAQSPQDDQPWRYRDNPPVPLTPTLDENAPKSCPARNLLMKYPVSRNGGPAVEFPVWQLPQRNAFFFVSGMTIDADGAPNAYGPNNSGLDDLINAGQPGHWDGLLADEDGNPLVQGPDDPFPGFYISCTALFDRTKAPHDPTRFVDATKIPYVVLPGDVSRQTGARLGDFAVVANLRNGKSSYAIFGDIGTFGEGSVALAQNVGIWHDARNGGARNGVLYLVFPGSGNRQPRPVEEINSETEMQLQNWGGMEQLTSCASDQTPPPFGQRPRTAEASTQQISN